MKFLQDCRAIYEKHTHREMRDIKAVISLQMLMSAWRRGTAVLKLLLARTRSVPIVVSAATGSMAIRISAKVCLLTSVIVYLLHHFHILSSYLTVQ